MTAQKVICLLSIIASVVCFVYSLGLMTDLYDSLYPVTDRYVTLAQKTVYKDWPKGEPYPDTGFGIYKEMQPFNTRLLLASTEKRIMTAESRASASRPRAGGRWRAYRRACRSGLPGSA